MNDWRKLSGIATAKVIDAVLKVKIVKLIKTSDKNSECKTVKCKS